MHTARWRFVIPIVIVILGTAWLLDTLGVVPGFRWVRTVGLATAGVLTIVLGGVNKLTLVMGPFLITASLCSALKQLGRLDPSMEWPILLIIMGCLLILVQVLKITTPAIMKAEYWSDGKKPEKE